jgi:uncharacterized protein
MTRLVLYLLRLYHHYLSPNLWPHSCRFTPTCSVYTYQAIAKYGILQGSFLGLKRLSRCHPFNSGGPDPIPNK